MGVGDKTLPLLPLLLPPPMRRRMMKNIQFENQSVRKIIVMVN